MTHKFNLISELHLFQGFKNLNIYPLTSAGVGVFVLILQDCLS